jgi:hypothetical protein
MEDIAQTIGIKLLTLMALTHLYDSDNHDLESLLEQVRAEVKKVLRAEADDA